MTRFWFVCSEEGSGCGGGRGGRTVPGCGQLLPAVYIAGEAAARRKWRNCQSVVRCLQCSVPAGHCHHTTLSPGIVLFRAAGSRHAVDRGHSYKNMMRVC